jgi:dihydroorotase (multifunctional complex type)
MIAFVAPSLVDLVVRNGTVVTADGRSESDIAIEGGRVVEVAARGRLTVTGRDELDATGRFVIPGVIDGHVHLRDPGLTWKEDFGSGTAAAVMGGVTTVLDMPNTIPPTDSVEHARLKADRVEEAAWCDVGLFALVGGENTAQVQAMADSGLVVGFKAFLASTTGDLPAPSTTDLRAAMLVIARAGMRLAVHAEDGSIVEREVARLRSAGRRDPMAHSESRPVGAEVTAIARIGRLALDTGCPVHVCHVTSAAGLDEIDRWRSHGADITCEVTPHHCLLGAEDMATLGTRMKVNPPIRPRAEGHAEALLDGLTSGRVDAIATDHAPHTRDEKLRDDVWDAASGFAGVEPSLRLFLTSGVDVGRLTLEQLVRATSEAPARAWGLWPRKGAVAVGSDADVTILDLDAEGVIEEARLHGRSNLTPFEGWRTRGAPVATIVRGTVVMHDGELIGLPTGRLVRRDESR